MPQLCACLPAIIHHAGVLPLSLLAACSRAPPAEKPQRLSSVQRNERASQAYSHSDRNLAVPILLYCYCHRTH